MKIRALFSFAVVAFVGQVAEAAEVNYLDVTLKLPADRWVAEAPKYNQDTSASFPITDKDGESNVWMFITPAITSMTMRHTSREEWAEAIFKRSIELYSEGNAASLGSPEVINGSIGSRTVVKVKKFTASFPRAGGRSVWWTSFETTSGSWAYVFVSNNNRFSSQDPQTILGKISVPE